jgi:hypothetical protein
MLRSPWGDLRNEGDRSNEKILNSEHENAWFLCLGSFVSDSCHRALPPSPSPYMPGHLTLNRFALMHPGPSFWAADLINKRPQQHDMSHLKSKKGDGANGYLNGPSMYDRGPTKVPFFQNITKYLLNMIKTTKCMSTNSRNVIYQKNKTCGNANTSQRAGGGG